MNTTETTEPTEVAQKQAELQAAWEALQAVPSYVEQQAKEFANGKTEVTH